MIKRTLVLFILIPWKLLQWVTGLVGMLIGTGCRVLLAEDDKPEHERSLVWRYTVNSFVSDDQRWNAAQGGDPDETGSSRAGRTIAVPAEEAPCWICWRLAWPFCWALDKLERRHCPKYADFDRVYRAGLIAWARWRRNMRAEIAAGAPSKADKGAE